MTKAEMLARIDAELARLAALTPEERKQVDRLLAQGHAIQTTQDMMRKVFGK